MATVLARQFKSLWESSDGPPDVFAFLDQHNGSDAADKLGVLLTDQHHRWNTDQPLKVEDYLQKLPDFASEPDFKLQLAIGEFQARKNGDTSLGIEEFTSRFADIGDTLRSRLSEIVSRNKGDDKCKLTRTETYINENTIGDQIGRYPAGASSR